MPSTSSMYAKPVKADFNGALLTVRQSRNPCLVGRSGIVLHETENVLKLITRKNQLKPAERDPTQTLQRERQDLKTLCTVIDKPYIELDLYGNQFCFRSADRSNRIFKAKEMIEL